MKEIFSFIGKLIAMVAIIIGSIMISAWAFSIIYGAACGFIDNLPTIPYGTWMTIATMCVLIVKFWPFRNSGNGETIALFSWEGVGGLLGIYLTQLIYIGSAILSFLIAAQF